jgi:hypothetical protein
VAERTARLELQFATLQYVAPFTDPEVRSHFYRRFAALDLFRHPDERTERYPAIYLSDVHPGRMSSLLAILGDMAVRVREAAEATHLTASGGRGESALPHSVPSAESEDR